MKTFFSNSNENQITVKEVKKMSVNELVINYKTHNPDGCFFNKSWLNFFGESFSKMKVLKDMEEYMGHTCYVLITYQKNSPFENKWAKHYFDCKTFDHIA